MPIRYLCISTNRKYEGVRGVRENVLGKTTRKDFREGTGAPQRYWTISSFFLCNISLSLLWFHPFNTQN